MTDEHAGHMMPAVALEKRRGELPPGLGCLERFLTLCLAASSLAVVMQLPVRAAEVQTTETITGRMVNGTFNNRPVAGQLVRLVRVSADSVSVLASTQTDRNGHFGFTLTRKDGTYVVTAVYRGVEYTSQPVGRSLNAAAVVDLPVYEPTPDRPAISFLYRLVLVDRLGVGVISFREIVGVSNPSSQTYLGGEIAPGKRATFLIDIPAGARDVTALRGVAAPIIERGRLIETSPLPPGGWEIAFAYQLRYWGTRARVRWTLEENTGSMDVVVPDRGVGLSSSLLERKPSGEVRGQRLLRLARDNLPKGQVIEVTLTGLQPNYAPVARWLAVVLALVLAISLVTSLRISRVGALSHRPSG